MIELPRQPTIFCCC